PGLKIVYPATARDAKGLIKASIRDEDPVIYLEHKWLYRRIKEALPDEEEILTPIGEARLAREGKDLSIVTYGATVWKSLEAADQLAKDDGLAVEVLDLRTLLPMDDAAIMRTVQKTNKVLIVHEDTRTGGLAGEIAARINEQAFAWLDGPIMRVTAHDVPLPPGGAPRPPPRPFPPLPALGGPLPPRWGGKGTGASRPPTSACAANPRPWFARPGPSIRPTPGRFPERASRAASPSRTSWA